MSESKGAPCIANEYGHRLYGSKFRFHNLPDPFGEVATLRHQIATAQAENEALRARVAELEKCVDDGSDSWLLRKQGEAVEVLATRLKEAADKAEEGFDDESDTACTLLIAKSVALKEARRLRQQADEAERTGGEK